MAVRDALGTFYGDERFAGLFSDRRQPAETPWRLALVTILQFAEGLTDRQAADALAAIRTLRLEAGGGRYDPSSRVPAGRPPTDSRGPGRTRSLGRRPGGRSAVACRRGRRSALAAGGGRDQLEELVFQTFEQPQVLAA